MYLAHFGLSKAPFGITPDTSFVYPGGSYLEGLNLLHFALASGEGFVKVVGEVGTGKTQLCRNLLADLDDGWKAAYIPNPQMGPRDFLLELAEDIGAPSGGVEVVHVIKRINRRLIEYARDGKKVVLCVDEAQSMSRLTLESLRLLSNLETEKRKLVHIVLFGQPELDEMLSAHSARQLLQRIAFHHRLENLDKSEVGAYVTARLDKAGAANSDLFDAKAIKMLYRCSGGTPRLVNILAHKALLAVWGEGGEQAGARHVKAAALDTEGAIKPPFSWFRWRRRGAA